MKLVMAIIKPFKLDEVREALIALGLAALSSRFFLGFFSFTVAEAADGAAPV